MPSLGSRPPETIDHTLSIGAIPKESCALVRSDKSLTYSYSHGPFSFIVHRPRYSQWIFFVYFVDLILCRPFQHATLASLMQARFFYSFRRPSLPHCIQHRKFLVYGLRNGKTALNWMSDTFVTRTGDRFTLFACHRPECHNIIEIII
jgi:hypothetical protein